MRIRSEQLTGHLSKQLLPAYLITGDELLITQECCDTIRQHCRKEGISEREVLNVDRSFDWGQLLDSGQSMSLFGDRKLIELRIGDSKMDQKSSAALQEYLGHVDGSNILLVSCGKLDSRSMNSKWVKALDAAGAVIQVWPIERQHLDNWIMQRMRKIGLNADSDAVQLLADRVEGNLLAADQEIAKLKILAGERSITADVVANAVASSARYDVFKLIDTALAGNAGNALQMLNSLQAEGGEDIAMLGAVTREIRTLYQCAQQLEQGGGIDRVLDGARVWDKRKSLYKNTLRRLKSAQLGKLLQLATRIDAAQKGQSKENASILFANLVSLLAGQKLAEKL
ncbi:DNA polymerase III subunit delta [Zhongshania aquimaris]|uniref:DNA polymerase III subunit delta n=1 Tax=Zhongshania aquimaris TaxID=2857107 RepID=A0ABS6VPQ1_9GAMM|nr:DNA polymerase III subunit delta [Zhongshania aquimaris]MBW2940295.1 DNA polymerase III subunit delta [Zhongshania aquimaris]